MTETTATDAVLSAALNWRAQVALGSSHPNLWADDHDFALIEAVDALLAERATAVQNLLDDATKAFADADTSSERVEVIRDLLAGWYAAWPDSAVTDPHEGIAWQLVSLVDAAEARASTPAAAEPESDARRLLDQAIATALPLAGGRVRELLDALSGQLADVDAKRAKQAEG